ILYSLLTHQSLSRSQIIDQTLLAPSTVSGITTGLLDEGLIRRTGNIGRSGAGRRSEVLARNPSAGCVAAVHITPERSRIGIVDLGYSVLSSEDLNFPGGFREEHTGAIVSALQRFTRQLQSSRRVSGVVLALPNQPYSIETIQREFERSFPALPVYRINNTEAMAVHELYQRRSAQLRTAIYVYVGTGIGSGFIIDGSLYRGVHGDACDFGHIYVTDRPLVCRCGREGCLETVASERAIAAALSDLYGLSAPPVREELIQLLISRLSEGDERAAAVVRKAADYLGKGIFNLVSITDPERVIVAGRLTALGPLYSSLVQESYMKRARRFSPHTVPLEFVGVKDDSALIGGAIFAFISRYCGAMQPTTAAA
ncbi:ROK family transcriptional regulator, partial [Salinispira pacifica]